MNKRVTSIAVPAQITEKLRAMIVRGSLGPGMRLGQAELAVQFKASRVPVREALKLLTSEGIVEHDPNRGFFVTRLSQDEAEQVFLMRDLIEDTLIRTIELPDETHLEDLARRADLLEQLLDSGDRAGWWSENREFEIVLLGLSPKKIMVREAMRLWTLSDRFRALLPLPGKESRAALRRRQAPADRSLARQGYRAASNDPA